MFFLHVSFHSLVNREVTIVRKFRFFSIILALVLMTSILSSGATTVLANNFRTHEDTGYTAFIDDSADFLTESQEQELMKKMADITEYSNVILVTTTSHHYSSTDSFAWDYYREIFGSKQSGIIFVIDRCLNKIYLVSVAGAEKKISTGRCLTITDNTYKYATAKKGYDYYACCSKTFDQVLTLYKGGRIAQPMKYITNTLLAIILAMLLNFILAMMLSKSKKASLKDILSGVFHSENINNPNVIFIRQDKRYSPPSSSSGGNHSGGGSHSGGGHSI